MNTLNTYQQKAHDTKARRAKAGKYPTPTQKQAFAKLISQGEKALTAYDFGQLATHPDMTYSQRSRYLAMAMAAN